jgi:hypothetical protein
VTPIDRALARRLVASAERGVPVSPPALAAARRIVAGGHSPGDAALVRQSARPEGKPSAQQWIPEAEAVKAAKPVPVPSVDDPRLKGKERKIGVALGKKLGTIERMGGGLTEEQLLAARRLRTRKATQEDMQVARDVLGIQRSGAARLTAFTRQIKTAEKNLQNLSRDIALAKAGGLAGQAYIALRAQQVLAGTLAKNKPWLEGVAARLAVEIGKRPQAGFVFINAISRGLKVGGIVGTVAVIVAKAAHETLSAIRSGYQAQVRAYGARREFGNLPLARRIAREAEERARGEERLGVLERAPWWIGEAYRAGRMERTAELEGREQDVRKTLRQLVGSAGVPTRAAIIGRLAREKGLRPQDLTDAEVTAAVDEATQRTSERLDEGTAFARWYRAQYALLTPMQRAGVAVTGERRWHAEQLARYRDLRARTLAQQQADERSREELAWRRMTPLERQRRSQAQDDAAAAWTERRSRHAAHVSD